MEKDEDLDHIVDCARRGERNAWAELYTRFGKRIFGLAYHLLASQEDAADALSEIFLRLPRSIAQYDGRVPLEKWLMPLAAHYCIDRLRRRRREKLLFEALDEPVEGVAAETRSVLEEMLTNERKSTVQAAIRALPERHRVPLVLRYYGDFSYEQIAERLGIDRVHVGVLLFRAKTELRKRLAEGQS